MPVRRLLGPVLAMAFVLLALQSPIFHAHISPRRTQAEETVLSVPGADLVPSAAGRMNGNPVWDGHSLTTVQAQDDAGGSDDDRVTVMLAVFGAAAFAVIVGSVGFLLRRLLGLVKPPPEQPPAEHH